MTEALLGDGGQGEGALEHALDPAAVIALAISRAAYLGKYEDGSPVNIADVDPDLPMDPEAAADVAAILSLLGGGEEEAAQYAFDPNEPRDKSGEWTEGGGTGARPPEDRQQRKEKLKAARRGFRSVMRDVFGVDSAALDDDLVIEQAGRELHLEYYPHDASVFVEFTQPAVADPSAKQGAKGTGWDTTSGALQTGTVDILHKFTEMLGKLSKAGVGVHYETTDPRRRRVYAKALAAAGFEETPSADPESSQWRPKPAAGPQQYAFDPAEKRDESGKWTAGGGGGSAAAHDADAPEGKPGRLRKALESAKGWLTPRGVARKARALAHGVRHPVEAMRAGREKLRLMKAKYGAAGALVIVGGYVGYYTLAAMNPGILKVPVPLTPTLLTLARLTGGLERKLRGIPAEPVQNAREEPLDVTTALEEVKALVAAVAAAQGEDAPQIDDEVMRAVLAGMLVG